MTAPLVILRAPAKRILITWDRDAAEPSAEEVVDAVRAEVPQLGARLAAIRLTVGSPGVEVRAFVSLSRTVSKLGDAFGVGTSVVLTGSVPGAERARLGVELLAVAPPRALVDPSGERWPP